MTTRMNMVLGDPLYAQMHDKDCVIDIDVDDFQSGQVTNERLSFKSKAEGHAFVLGWQMAMGSAGLADADVVESVYHSKEQGDV